MEVESDMVLNWTNSKFFVKMIKIKGFKNLKNLSQDRTKGLVDLKPIHSIIKQFIGYGF